MKLKNKVVTRIAPSPTGNLHIGTARTALFNFLYARKMGGKFILRMEDTDLARSNREFETDIKDGLTWLGLSWDETYRQSERFDIYRDYAEKLVSAGLAKKEMGERGEAIIYNNPPEKITFTDLVRGEISFEPEDDQIVLIKSDGSPTYNFAVVVDDHESEVTHVIRGEDHISNTPRQIALIKALEWEMPLYAHIPLILAPDRSKLSKRHGAVSLLEYKERGYLPQALMNYLALLGWNPGTEKEIFTPEELIQTFDLDRIHKGGAIFDEEKLKWVNKEHIKLLTPEEQFEIQKQEIEKAPYFSEVTKLDVEKISWKKVPKEKTIEHLTRASELVGDTDALMQYATEVGKGDVLWPVRYALTSQEKSPDPFTIIKVLGPDESKKRIENAIKILKDE